MGHRPHDRNDFSPWAKAPAFIAQDLVDQLRASRKRPDVIAAAVGCRPADLLNFMAGRKPISRGTATKVMRYLRDGTTEGSAEGQA